jgi:hypothetical protein
MYLTDAVEALGIAREAKEGTQPRLGGAVDRLLDTESHSHRDYRVSTAALRQ